MRTLERLADWLGLRDDTGRQSEGTKPPARSDATVATPSSSLTISTVYRGVEIHHTAVQQLSIDLERNDAAIAPSTLIRKPDVNQTRPEWLAYLVTSLALHGNAFWRIDRNERGDIINLTPLDPNLCHPFFTDRHKTRRAVQYDGKTLVHGRDVMHLRKMTVPGHAPGLGPIQAARVELGGALALRDYSSGWFDRGDVPNGVLSTKDQLTTDQARAMKKVWIETADGGVRVIGNGLTYAPIMLKPADAQWLESRQFTTTEIARLLGIPASLMLAAIEGSSSTYSNVEQDWIGYVRFSLMSYLRPIEAALTEMFPRGQEARFNIDALLRTDTKTRYEAHKIAIDAGFKTVEEVRQEERLGPLPALTQELPA